MSNTPHSSSVALVRAKIEQNKRIKEEANQKRRAEEEAKYAEYVAFWEPVMSEIRAVSAAYPSIQISPPFADLTKGYTIGIAGVGYRLHSYEDGRVGCACSRVSGSFRSANLGELLTSLLELIAEKLS